MLQAIPLNKRWSFNNINDWSSFKTRLIEEFGSIDIFGRDVNQIFDFLPRYKIVQEVAEDLAPKIKTLQANLEIIKQFQDMEDLHNISLTQHLVQNVMRSLPIEVRSSFNNQFMEFRGNDHANIRPPATFLFLAQYVNKLEKNYRTNPSRFDLNFSPLNVGIKPVWYGSPGYNSKTPLGRPLAPPLKNPPSLHPLYLQGIQIQSLCPQLQMWVAKLSSPNILKIISDTKVCPSCTHVHDPSYKCKLTFFNSASKVCPKGCKHDGFPLYRHACMHSNQTPSVFVSKVASDRSIPLVETIPMGAFTMGIQYDTGCQLSLISLLALPTSMYS